MKKEIANKLIVALRSGKYKKCSNQLRRGDRFCALGVLCNLHAQEHPEIAARQDTKESYMGQITTPPASVRKWARLTDYHRIMIMNDNGSSFNKIADYIEKNWREL